jgi:hypothetical protein
MRDKIPKRQLSRYKIPGDKIREKRLPAKPEKNPKGLFGCREQVCVCAKHKPPRPLARGKLAPLLPMVALEVNKNFSNGINGE